MKNRLNFLKEFQQLLNKNKKWWLLPLVCLLFLLILLILFNTSSEQVPIFVYPII